MNLVRRLWHAEDGQGLTEYTLVVLLVALTFWVAVKQSDLGGVLDKVWGLVSVCVLNPLNCNGS